MSAAREADVAILDTIESDLAMAAKKRKIAGKRSAKGRSEKECGSGTVLDPTGVPPETDSSTGGAVDADDQYQDRGDVGIDRGPTATAVHGQRPG